MQPFKCHFLPPSSLSFGEQSWRETSDEWGKPVTTPYSTWAAASCYNIYVLFHWDGTLLTWPKCSSHSPKNTAESRLHWQLCTCSVWPCESSLTHWDFFWFKATHQLLNLCDPPVFSWPRSKAGGPPWTPFFRVWAFFLSLCWGLESV